MAEGCHKYNFTCYTDHAPKRCTSLNSFTLDYSILTTSIAIAGVILFLNLVILWTARKKHCRTPINRLVYGLCIEDLLTAVVIIPLFIASFRSETLFLSGLCDFYGMSVVFMSMASGSTVCLISILQTYAYLRPLAFRCHVRTYTVRVSSMVRYVSMVIFVLPCVIHDGFNFQYDASGHMCTWNFNGHTSSGTRFNYLKFATWFYPLFGMLQIILMVSSVAVAIILVTKARYYVKMRNKMHLKTKVVNKRGKAPNLAEGVLLSLSYLIGVSFLIISQVNDYLIPSRKQIGFMVECHEWNIFKTSAVFLTSLLNQFAIGLKNRRIRHQLLRDLRTCITVRYNNIHRKISRDYLRTALQLRGTNRLNEIYSINPTNATSFRNTVSVTTVTTVSNRVSNRVT